MKVLVLEDERYRIAKFEKRYGRTDLTIVSSAYQAIELLKKIKFDLIFLDHDLSKDDFKDNGMLVADFMKDSKIDTETIIHSLNTQKARKMQEKIMNSKCTRFTELFI